jgi:hypothetical protein
MPNNMTSPSKEDQLITVLNDGDTFTVVDGSKVVLMSPDWNGFDVDPDAVVEEFYLDSPADLRRLASIIEKSV